MNLSRPSEVHALLAALSIRPSRALGQNFLVDRNILRLLVDAAGVQSGERVIEVGPGLGVVTAELLARGARVTAIEYDHRLCAHLRATLGATPGFDLIESDVLAVSLPDVLPGASAIVSNLPYSVGSRFLAGACESGLGPARIVVTVQKEVAQRLAATPGGPAYGLLSVWAQLDYNVELLRDISPSCFHPRPEVTSSIVRLVRRRVPLPDVVRNSATALSRGAFQRRRNQMLRFLRTHTGSETQAATALRQAGIAPTARPETIDRDGWIRLAEALG